ncbi:hypothetical protein FCIRC_1002 [Fusarium circinatum]|uniref:Uncharacterized protein n=1 Tax=Fusarium circinatum TaxID=48490 RepID=A0A8H5ULN2_FUSCI|nr:hypothetical protein FCIRC_1002 [Fusarium circinatum]
MNYNQADNPDTSSGKSKHTNTQALWLSYAYKHDRRMTIDVRADDGETESAVFHQIAMVLADQSIKFPSGHLKVLQAGGISAMAKHYHPEGNGECFHALPVFEVESVCGGAAVYVEEKKPMRLAFRILPLLQIYSKPFHRTKAALAQPPISSHPEPLLMLSGLRYRVAFLPALLQPFNFVGRFHAYHTRTPG